MPTEIPLTLLSILQHTVHNTYTDKMTNIKRTNVTDRQHELHSKNQPLMEENEGQAREGSSSGALPLAVVPKPEAQADGESSSVEEVVRPSTSTRPRPARPRIIMPPLEECFIDLE